jgi:hypothetical protein
MTSQKSAKEEKSLRSASGGRHGRTERRKPVTKPQQPVAAGDELDDYSLADEHLNSRPLKYHDVVEERHDEEPSLHEIIRVYFDAFKSFVESPADKLYHYIRYTSRHKYHVLCSFISKLFLFWCLHSVWYLATSRRPDPSQYLQKQQDVSALDSLHPLGLNLEPSMDATLKIDRDPNHVPWDENPFRLSQSQLLRIPRIPDELRHSIDGTLNSEARTTSLSEAKQNIPSETRKEVKQPKTLREHNAFLLGEKQSSRRRKGWRPHNRSKFDPPGVIVNTGDLHKVISTNKKRKG